MKSWYDGGGAPTSSVVLAAAPTGCTCTAAKWVGEQSKASNRATDEASDEHADPRKVWDSVAQSIQSGRFPTMTSFLDGDMRRRTELNIQNIMVDNPQFLQKPRNQSRDDARGNGHQAAA